MDKEALQQYQAPIVVQLCGGLSTCGPCVVNHRPQVLHDTKQLMVCQVHWLEYLSGYQLSDSLLFVPGHLGTQTQCN